MATKTRTYLPTDWQVWTYAPLAGAFRLDFSVLNGSDTLGATGGSMAVLDLDINSINIDDGDLPINSVLASMSPATATISASTNTWNAAFIKELYSGKYIAITLKNESLVDIDVYGKNSVFFLGTISNVNYDVDPIAQVTNYTISATDILSNALNQPIEVNRSATATKSSSIFAGINAKPELFDSHLTIAPNIDMTANFETNTTESRSLGNWLDDFIKTYVSIPICYYYNAGSSLVRQIDMNALHAKPSSGTQITNATATRIMMITDGAEIPTSFNFNNTTTTYAKGSTDASILTQPINYSTSLDVNGQSQLQQVADKISSYTPELSPTYITIKTATPFQPIVFDNSQAQSGGQYYYPNNWFANGTDLDVYLAYFASGGVTPHYYTKIVGQSHEITPDYWQTTYKLMKGK